MAQVKLTFNSVEYVVDCSGVQVGWTNNTIAKPNANGTSVAEVQTQTFENPTYTLQAVELTERSGTLTYAALLSMVKNKYSGSNGITLSVDYGVSSSKSLVASDGSTTDIPVVIKSFSPRISLNATSDGANKNHSMENFNIVLQETA